MRRAAHLFGPHSTKLPPVADTGVGAPTPKALSSQQTKVERLERPGLARFTVEELSLRGIPFPPPIVKQLAQRVAGADSTGAVPLRVSPGFADVRIHPTAVVLYRVKRSAP